MSIARGKIGALPPYTDVVVVAPKLAPYPDALNSFTDDIIAVLVLLILVIFKKNPVALLSDLNFKATFLGEEFVP